MQRFGFSDPAVEYFVFRASGSESSRFDPLFQGARELSEREHIFFSAAREVRSYFLGSPVTYGGGYSRLMLALVVRRGGGGEVMG